MENLEISLSKKTGKVELPQSVIGRDSENLQAKLVFSFSDEFVDGSGRLDYQIGTTKYQILATKDATEETYSVDVKNVLTKEGQIYMQLVVVEPSSDYVLTSDTEIVEGKTYYTKSGDVYSVVTNPIASELSTYYELVNIPIFKSNVFYMYCSRSINATTEQPETYTYWLDILQEKINEADNLDIEASKSGTTTTVTITKKDGTTTTTNVNDGADGEDGADGADFEYNWNGTSLGVKTSEETEYEYVDLKGSTGATGAAATINGVNALTITTSGVITGTQSGSTYTIGANLSNYATTTQLSEEATTRENADNLKQNITDTSLTTTAQTIPTAINEVNSIAKGCNQAKGYTNYSSLITELNSASASAYKVGQSYLIQTLNVPDLWVISVESTSVSYTYTTDAQFITDTSVSGGCQVGYYKLGQLETLKQDLTNYVQFTNYATDSVGGVFKTGGSGLTFLGGSNQLAVLSKTYSEYQNLGNYAIIGKGTLENVITGKGLATQTYVQEYVDSLNANNTSY